MFINELFYLTSMISKGNVRISPEHVADVRQRGLRYLSSLGFQHPFHSLTRAQQVTLPSIDLLVEDARCSEDFFLDLPGRVVLEAAAAFIDTGIAQNRWPVQKAQASNYFLRQELGNSHLFYSSKMVTIAQDLIHTGSIRATPFGPLKKLFHDANFSYCGREDFSLWNNLLRQEARLHKDCSLHETAKSDELWNAYSLARLRSIQWYSVPGYKLFEAQRKQNIKALEQSH